MGYYTVIYRDISCDITPHHSKAQAQHNFNKDRPPCCGLRFAFGPFLCAPLALSPACPFFSSSCCRSDGHIIGLTVPLANINLVPSWFGLLPECMVVFVAFFYFLFLFLLPSCYIYIECYPYRNMSNIFLGSDIDTCRKYINIAWYTEKSWYDTE